MVYYNWVLFIIFLTVGCVYWNQFAASLSTIESTGYKTCACAVNEVIIVEMGSE